MRNADNVKGEFYMGARRPPNPPSAERRAANFWFMPQHPAPILPATDERENSINRRGASPLRGLGAHSPHKYNVEVLVCYLIGWYESLLKKE